MEVCIIYHFCNSLLVSSLMAAADNCLVMCIRQFSFESTCRSKNLTQCPLAGLASFNFSLLTWNHWFICESTRRDLLFRSFCFFPPTIKYVSSTCAFTIAVKSFVFIINRILSPICHTRSYYLLLYAPNFIVLDCVKRFAYTQKPYFVISFLYKVFVIFWITSISAA